MHVNLIGPGRLGKALATSLIHTGEHTLLGVYHPNIARAQQASKALGQGTPVDSLAALSKADITLITCPDDVIPSLVKQLAAAAVITPGSIVMHLSGILSSDILMPLKKQGACIASLHPLKAFRETTYPETTAFQNIHCALEGDSNAIKTLTPLWQAMGAHVFTLSSDKKASYHAAAVMASNYLVTLAAEAMSLFKASGVSQAHAQTICLELMQTSLDNLKQTDTPAEALTGPLVRGDIETIKQHLNTMSSKTTNDLYCAAGLATLPLVDLDNESMSALKQCLSIKLK